MWSNPLHFVSPDVQIEQSQVKAQPSLNCFCLSGVEANLWESIFLSTWSEMSFTILPFCPYISYDICTCTPPLYSSLSPEYSQLTYLCHEFDWSSQTNLCSSLNISDRPEFHLLGVDWLHGARPSAVWRARVVCQGKAEQGLELWPQLKECWQCHL